MYQSSSRETNTPKRPQTKIRAQPTPSVEYQAPTDETRTEKYGTRISKLTGRHGRPVFAEAAVPSTTSAHLQIKHQSDFHRGKNSNQPRNPTGDSDLRRNEEAIGREYEPAKRISGGRRRPRRAQGFQSRFCEGGMRSGGGDAMMGVAVDGHATPGGGARWGRGLV